MSEKNLSMLEKDFLVLKRFLSIRDRLLNVWERILNLAIFSENNFFFSFLDNNRLLKGEPYQGQSTTILEVPTYSWFCHAEAGPDLAVK